MKELTIEQKKSIEEVTKLILNYATVAGYEIKSISTCPYFEIKETKEHYIRVESLNNRSFVLKIHEAIFEENIISQELLSHAFIDDFIQSLMLMQFMNEICDVLSDGFFGYVSINEDVEIMELSELIKLRKAFKFKNI